MFEAKIFFIKKNIEINLQIAQKRITKYYINKMLSLTQYVYGGTKLFIDTAAHWFITRSSVLLCLTGLYVFFQPPLYLPGMFLHDFAGVMQEGLG